MGKWNSASQAALQWVLAEYKWGWGPHVASKSVICL